MGITPQNEPENPFNEPSMLMSAGEQIDFINNHLGPQIEAAGFSPKIIAFDHNCDNPQYPIDVLNNSSYAEGAAFHLYDPGANIEAMSQVRNATGKNVYFTEQFTSSEGEFNGDFGFHMENVVIGSLRNWSKTVIEWNYAADPDSNPRTPGGCTECLGAITVNNANSLTRNVSYYIISQLSKFVQPGAVRLASNDPDDDTLTNVALRNEDGEKVLVVYNINSADQEVSINWNGRSFTYDLPGRAAATFTWEGDFTPQPPAIPTNVVAATDDMEVALSWNDANRATSYSVRWATNPNGPYTTIANGLTNTIFTDTNVTNGTTYYYVIRAINEVGTTDSAQVAAVPNIIIIDAFSQIEGEDFNQGQDVQLEDTQDVGGGQNVGFIDSNDFLLFENVDFGNGARSIDVRIASGANFVGSMELRLGGVTGTLIGTVSFGNTGGYQSWVTRQAPIEITTGLNDLYLVFQGGEGIGNVNWFRFNEEDLGDPPTAPTNLTAVAGDEIVSLSWNVVAEATTYELSRSTSSTSGFAVLADGLTQTSVDDTNVTNGTQYFYRVRAVNIAGTSQNSNTASATPEVAPRSAFVRIEAEDFDESQGVQVQQTSDTGGGENVGFINNGNYLVFNNVDFEGGAGSLEARIASNANFTGTMDVRLGSLTGNSIATVNFGNTGGWQSWVTRSVNVSQVSGVHDIYLVFSGDQSGGIGNVNWIIFNEDSITGDDTDGATTRSAFVRIEAEDFDDSQGVQTQQTSDTGGGENVGFITNGNYLVFNNVDFEEGAQSIEARIASNANFTGTMDIRLGSLTGNSIATISFGNTGGWQSWVTRTENTSEVTGVHDIYLVFAASSGGGIGNVNRIIFNPGTAQAPPAAPASLTATAGDAVVMLDWNAVENANTYQVRRSTSATIGFSTIASGVASTSYQDQDVTNGTQYYYRVRAINQAGSSGDSNTANARPQAVTNPNTGNSIVSGGTYIIRNRRTDRVMDVADNSQNNGAIIQQWEPTGGDNQRWIIEDEGEGQYKITAVHSNKVLDLTDGSLQDGTGVQQFDSFDNVNQRWELVPIANNFFEVVSVRSGKALQISNGNATLGAPVVQQSRNQSAEQQWAFELVGTRASFNDVPAQNVRTRNVAIYTNQFSENTLVYELEQESAIQTVEILIYNTLGQVVSRFIDQPTPQRLIQRVSLSTMTTALATGQYFVQVGGLKAKPFMVTR